MKASPLKNDFMGGEFSPLTYARVDSDLYATGLAKCFNYIPLLQGPITRRPGTYFVANGRDSGGGFGQNYVRVIPFEFSNVQAYVLEFSYSVVRFYRNNALVESSPGVPYELTVPYLDYHLDDLYYVQSADVLYIFHPQFPPKKISRISNASWTITDFAESDGPYEPQNIGAVTLTPSATTGTGINITASAATFDTSSAGANEIGRLIRIKHTTTWGYAKITAVTSSTVVVANVISAFGATTAVTIWRLGLWRPGNYPTCATFHEDRLFTAGCASRPQQIDGSVVGDYENFKPTAADSVVTATNAVSFTLNSTDVNVIQWITSDEKGLLVGTTSNEWTVRAASSNEALTAVNIQAKRGSAYGSKKVQPMQVGKSALFVQRAGRKVRDMRYYYDVDGFRAADITFISEHITLGGIKQLALQKEPQQIIWAVREDGALLGMSYEREFETVKVGWHRHQIGGVSDIAGIPAKVKSIAVIPSADGLRDELWMVVQRYIDGEKIYQVEYMTRLFEEQEQEDAFFVDCGLTYNSPLPTNTFTFGATTLVNTGDPHGWVDGNRVRFDNVPGSDGAGEAMPLNGNVYEIDVQSPNTFTIKTLAGANVDSTGWVYSFDGTNAGEIRKLVSTVGGLSHLEGQTVEVYADGSPQSAKVVTGGSITLTSAAAVISVGFGYTSEGQMLRQEAGATEGTALGKTRRTNRVGFYFHRTVGIEIGMDLNEPMNPIIFRKSNDMMNEATDLYSGIYSGTMDAPYDFENQICWRQTRPVPGTILSIMPQMMLQERG